MNQQFNNRLNVVRMYCIPTEHRYNDVYQRSFSLGMNPGETEQMQSYFRSQGVANNAQLSMTSAAVELGNVIRISPIPTGKVHIPHGWETQRLMFVLVVDEIINDTAYLTHYIQGYSEYYDPSHAGTLDPNASYFINSVTTVTRTKNLITNQMDSRVTSVYNVICDPTGKSGYQEVTAPGDGLQLIRPADVITNIYASNIYSDMDNVNINVSTTSLSNGANVSSRANNDPLKYFTNTVNAVITGKSVSDGFATPESVLTNASGVIAEQTLTTNGFIYAIARATGDLEPGYFTLNILTTIDPSVSSKITLVNTGTISRDPVVNNNPMDTAVTESMLNYTAESEIAQMFMNALTANMSENLVTVLSGTITNSQITPITTISHIQSFLDGVDVTPYGNRIVNYINAVIIPQLTANGMRLISIVFDCDLLGDTTVSVSLENQPAVIYRLPTFADSLYSPVLTNSSTKDMVIGNFENILDGVMGMSPQPIQGEYNGYQ